MEYSHYCILLLLISIGLLVMEVFVPTGGFVGALMLVALIGSVICAYYAWWETSRSIWWGYVVCVVILLPAVLIGAFAIFPRTPYGRRVLLDAPKSEEITPYAKEQQELQKLVGQSARAVTPHRPSGLISVEGRNYHAETRGMMLEADDAVTIVAVRGNRLVVRLAETMPSESEPAEAGEGTVEDSESKQEKPRPDAPFDPFLGDAENRDV